MVRNQDASVVTWQGYPCLRLNGLAIVSDLFLEEGSVEACIGSDDVSYCGLAFRIRDTLNFELAYAQPHTSGRWDALQYDPVFHGSNTWQLYHGPGFQQTAEVPMGKWFRFRADFKDQRAVIQLENQPPLIVSQLAHSPQKGLIGLWSYKPAYFRDLRVYPSADADKYSEGWNVQEDEGVIKEWFLHGYGRVECEKNGSMNLNRFLPLTVSEASLTRRFFVRGDSDLILRFGFSDEIAVYMDGNKIFEGENKYKFSSEWNDQGYVFFDMTVTLPLQAGVHQIEVRIKRTEFFGWGFKLSLQGDVDLLSCAYSQNDD